MLSQNTWSWALIKKGILISSYFRDRKSEIRQPYLFSFKWGPPWLSHNIGEKKETQLHVEEANFIATHSQEIMGVLHQLLPREEPPVSCAPPTRPTSESYHHLSHPHWTCSTWTLRDTLKPYPNHSTFLEQCFSLSYHVLLN